MLSWSFILHIRKLKHTDIKQFPLGGRTKWWSQDLNWSSPVPKTTLCCLYFDILWMYYPQMWCECQQSLPPVFLGHTPPSMNTWLHWAHWHSISLPLWCSKHHRKLFTMLLEMRSAGHPSLCCPSTHCLLILNCPLPHVLSSQISSALNYGCVHLIPFSRSDTSEG